MGVCLGLFLAAAVLWSTLRGQHGAAGLPGAGAEAVAGSLYVGVVLTVVIVLRRGLDRRSLDSMGLSRLRAGELARGALVGAGTVAAVVAVGAAAGFFRIDVVAVGDAAWPVLDAAIATVVAMSCVAIAEEATFRGYVLKTLGERWPLWRATMVTGLMFGALHLFGVASAPEAALMMLSALTATVLLVASRTITGSIWWAVGWHAA